MELKKKRDAEAKEAQEANGEFELEIKKIENENEQQSKYATTSLQLPRSMPPFDENENEESEHTDISKLEREINELMFTPNSP